MCFLLPHEFPSELISAAFINCSINTSNNFFDQWTCPSFFFFFFFFFWMNQFLSLVTSGAYFNICSNMTLTFFQLSMKKAAPYENL